MNQELLHKEMAFAVHFFQRSINSGDGETAAYWLKVYHALWDALEAGGLPLEVNLPAIYPWFPDKPTDVTFLKFWPNTDLRWNEHQGFEEPKRS